MPQSHSRHGLSIVLHSRPFSRSKLSEYSSLVEGGVNSWRLTRLGAKLFTIRGRSRSKASLRGFGPRLMNNFGPTIRGVAFRVFSSIACRRRQTVCRCGVRQDATPLDPTHVQYVGVENVSRSFHATGSRSSPRVWVPPHNKCLSWSKDGTYLMRLPSGMGSACASAVATSLNCRANRSSRLIEGAQTQPAWQRL